MRYLKVSHDAFGARISETRVMNIEQACASNMLEPLGGCGDLSKESGVSPKILTSSELIWVGFGRFHSTCSDAVKAADVQTHVSRLTTASPR